MKPIKWVGAILLVAGVGAVVALQFSGLGFLGINHDTRGSQTVLVSFHWAIFPAAALGIAGLLLLIIPTRTPKGS